MPAAGPPMDSSARAMLIALGEQIRVRRKELGVSATVTAEAAGMSRVTLHRIERGESSVTMGAYLSAISAVGLELQVEAPLRRKIPHSVGESASGAGIRLADYAQLRLIAWQRDSSDEVTPQEALSLYERNWRHVDVAAMDTRERDLVAHLVETWGGGQLLV